MVELVGGIDWLGTLMTIDQGFACRSNFYSDTIGGRACMHVRQKKSWYGKNEMEAGRDGGRLINGRKHRTKFPPRRWKKEEIIWCVQITGGEAGRRGGRGKDGLR